MKKLIFTLALVLSFINGSAIAAESDIVGTILEVEGLATVTSTYTTPQAARVNTPVHPNDIIATGPRARVYIQLIDNTELTLGENGRLTIDEYVYNDHDDSDNHAIYSIAKGAFLYVSGLLAKKEKPDVTVNIPYGSIGIRGTKFWGGPVDNTYGVIVGEGVVVVDTDAGRATLKKGQGTHLKGKGQPPTPAQTWTPEKIATATKTVALKAPAVVGERMKQNAERNVLLRSRMRADLEKRVDTRKEDRMEKAPEASALDDDTPNAEEKHERIPELRNEKEERLNNAMEKLEKKEERYSAPEDSTPPDATEEPADTSVKPTRDDDTTSPINIIRSSPMNESSATDAAVDAVRDTVKPVTERAGDAAETTNRTTTGSIDAVRDTNRKRQTNTRPVPGTQE